MFGFICFIFYLFYIYNCDTSKGKLVSAREGPVDIWGFRSWLVVSESEIMIEHREHSYRR